MIDHPAPNFSIAEAELLVQDHFGLRGRVTELPSHLDQNFRLKTNQNTFVLKLSNTAAAPSYVDLQQAVLTYLHERGQGQHFPTIVPTQTGDQKVIVEGKKGEYHQMWMVTWLDGRVLAHVNPVLKPLLQDLGRFLGSLNQILGGFEHESMHRDYSWDLRRAGEFAPYIDFIPEAPRRKLAEDTLAHVQDEVLPSLDQLRQGVIHHDANDHNVIVQGTGYQTSIRGLIDFGDMLHTATVVELAIAATYVMMGRQDPVGVATEVVRGYHQTRALEESEIAVLYGLIKARLCCSVLVSAYRGSFEPDNKYLRISEKGAWTLLTELTVGPSALAEYRWRAACNMEPYPGNRRLIQRLQKGEFAAVMQPDLRTRDPFLLDMSVSSPLVEPLKKQPDPRRAADAWFRRIRRAGAVIGVGRYNEARIVYTADHYRSANYEFDETRTIHLGIDLFQEAGTPIYAPLAGHVHSISYSYNPMDFGGLIILEHTLEGERFYTLYGHLSKASVQNLNPGDAIYQGVRFAELGGPEENGGWIPHLHFQLITDMMGCSGAYWGVAPASQREVWLSICPDPNLILGIPASCLHSSEPLTENIQARRKECIGGNLSVSYRTPLHIVRGHRQYLYDHCGRAFLDAVNNVPHVGYSHPRVNAAAIRQMRVLNTNTRYLHKTLVEYAERLAATMPDPLNICYFVNSGSEANDLALRLAFAHTGRRDLVVLEGAYHGHLSSLIDISPYKFDGPGGTGAPSHVHQAPVPDEYRGRFRGGSAAEQYARELKVKIDSVPDGIAAFICESLLGCGGQIELPQGYLHEAYQHVRDAGGVCIADEVQVGFGRMGSDFWGFQTQQVTPDIVVLGKPMGNGHPLAGVVTTAEIAHSFDNGMEFFSTFGGNPVSCIVGMAVLDVIESENLQKNAELTGTLLKKALQDLKEAHPIIGDVRGRGLFLGVELVRDRETQEPADREATYIANRMRDHGILISTDGPLHNVLKIKPPMVFHPENAIRLAYTLNAILQEDGAGSVN